MHARKKRTQSFAILFLANRANRIYIYHKYELVYLFISLNWVKNYYTYYNWRL